MSVFKKIPKLPPDPLFGLKSRMALDLRKLKVDLGIGAYRDNSGKPWILPSVRKAEKKLHADPSYNHEYLPINGYAPFLEETLKVLFTKENYAKVKPRTVSSQLLSGTGALHFTGVFLSRFLSLNRTLYLSDPTWANHRQIFESLGFTVRTYPYWDASTKTLNLESMINAIKDADSGLVFLLHAVAHNPTGLDPTKPQWGQILDAIGEKKHFPIFDIAYQGFASGSLLEDAYSLNLGVEKLKNTPIMVCQSFAKNLGLYGERTGAVHLILPQDLKGVVPEDVEGPEELLGAISSQFKKIMRLEVSNPPAYGLKVAALVLSDPELRAEWERDLKTMSGRIYLMRVALRDLLTNKYKTPGNWDHIVNQIGMFSFTGLGKDEVKRLEEKHGVYMTANGRASVAGLNEGNVDYVAQAIDEVVRHKTKL